jgi:hypothetical protein
MERRNAYLKETDYLGDIDNIKIDLGRIWCECMD